MSYDPDFTKYVRETAPLGVPRWPQRDRSIFGLGNLCCGAEQGRDDLSGVEEVRLRSVLQLESKDAYHKTADRRFTGRV